jgi:small basic protein (TIGR04137 family)
VELTWCSVISFELGGAERDPLKGYRVGSALLEKRPHWLNVAPHFHCNVVTTFNFYLPMSQHRSLKGASTIAARRNVLKRFERVELLKKRGQWKESQKVLGLPKTKPDV